jgi:hypothetical protein
MFTQAIDQIHRLYRCLYLIFVILIDAFLVDPESRKRIVVNILEHSIQDYVPNLAGSKFSINRFDSIATNMLILKSKSYFENTSALVSRV